MFIKMFIEKILSTNSEALRKKVTKLTLLLCIFKTHKMLFYLFIFPNFRALKSHSYFSRSVLVHSINTALYKNGYPATYLYAQDKHESFLRGLLPHKRCSQRYATRREIYIFVYKSKQFLCAASHFIAM